MGVLNGKNWLLFTFYDDCLDGRIGHASKMPSIAIMGRSGVSSLEV